MSEHPLEAGGDEGGGQAGATPFHLDPAALRCPYPHFEALRARGRVVEVPEVGGPAITGYADIQTVLRHHGLVSSRSPTGPAVAAQFAAAIEQARDAGTLPPTVQAALTDPPDRTLFTIDPPDHTRQRRLVGRLFAPAQIDRWRPLVRDIAASQVEEVVARGRVELVRGLAVPIPVRVIAELLRIPASEHGTLKRWSDEVTAVIGNPHASAATIVASLASRQEMDERFAELLAEARRHPADDLVTAVAMAGADGAGEQLTESERRGLLVNFLIAGNETTTKLLAAGLKLLGERPELLGALRDDRSLVPAFVEEVLRLEPPTQGMFRRARQDIDLGGAMVPAGRHAFLLFAAGNRDPAAFEDPEAFRLDRPNGNRHLSFGHGIHLCLGAGLARMEAQVTFDAVVERVDRICLDPDATFEYEPTYLLHGLRSLPAALGPCQPFPPVDP
jgi:cytochrome P450